MIVLFGVFVRFGPEADAHWEEEKREMNLTSDIENDFYFRYPCEYLGSVVPVLAGPHPILSQPIASHPVAEPVKSNVSTDCWKVRLLP